MCGRSAGASACWSGVGVVSDIHAPDLLQAGDDFRFSLSDLTPAGFGGTEGRGMRKILRQFLVSRDVSGASLELEQAAGKAYPP